jgi:hypothetical protein
MAVDARFGQHAFGQPEDRTPTHAYEPMREAAMAAFAKSWSCFSFPKFAARTRPARWDETDDQLGAEDKKASEDAAGSKVDDRAVLGSESARGSDLVEMSEHDRIHVGKHDPPRRQMGVARALAKEPQIVLLDEPTASLDPAATKEIEDVIRKAAASGIRSTARPRKIW